MPLRKVCRRPETDSRFQQSKGAACPEQPETMLSSRLEQEAQMSLPGGITGADRLTPCQKAPAQPFLECVSRHGV